MMSGGSMHFHASKWIGMVGLTCIAVVVYASEPAFPLLDPGTEDIVDYEKYGEFRNVGTREYFYQIKDVNGLARASGEGIDPCRSLTNNPAYQAALKAGKLTKGDYWKHVNTSNPQLDFFVWSAAPEEPGVRLLFVGKALEKAGHLMHALKAYRASMVLYPDSAAWSSGGEFQWSSAEASWNAIQALLRKHPELGLRLVGADVTCRVENGNLLVAVTPGRFERVEPQPGAEQASEAPIVDRSIRLQQLGTGTVQLVQYGDGQWEMLVEGKPYFIRGMNYEPTKIGVVPWEWDWTWSDENTNGTVDGFEIFIDANNNGLRDEDEPVTTDYQLMKDMGVNTIRFYVTSNSLQRLNTLLFRKVYRDYGIRFLVGNFLGAYCNDSGAPWDPGTDYTSRKQRETMKANVSNMVMRLKGEPWVLAWILGNENNMEMSGDVNATRTNASRYPETYARFLNEVCKMVHQLDPDHPIGVGNLLVGLVEYYGKFAPEIDFIGINSYISEDGFGATWQKIKQTMDRPVVITEFGCDAYYTGKGPDEEMQSRWLRKNWEDIAYNRAGNRGVGNAIGGFVFQWVDEWWKDSLNYFENPMDQQSTRAVFPMPFPDGYAQEEWFGIFSQGKGTASPFLRIPRKAYFDVKAVWLQELQAESQIAIDDARKEGEQGREGK
jgi:hypothetical protein